MSQLDRIPTTHVGSLPRPPDVFALLEAKERDGRPPAGFAERLPTAVAEIVGHQVACGIDIVSDGEVGKFSYTFYVRHRLAGVETRAFGGPAPHAIVHQDLAEHPDFLARIEEKNKGVKWYELVPPPACTGPVSYERKDELAADLANLRAAAERHRPQAVFVNAASPGVLTKFVPNHYYGSEDAYLEALAEAMKVEYEAVHAAGFLLQIDAPDLASARHNQYQDLSDREFLRICERNIAVLNAATAAIPPERMRMHVCWGNYEGPHTHDVPFATIAPAVFAARPQAILFEAANPRHGHEWEELARLPIPEDKILVPGVIDTTTNFVEHPRLIAQRLCRYTDLVGRERVIAGTDCGFATFAGPGNPVVPSVVWAKLAALAEGAAIASERLW